MRSPIHLLTSMLTAVAGLTLAGTAQACGYTGVGGEVSWFSLDNPLDITLLSLGVGAVAAIVPARIRRKDD